MDYNYSDVLKRVRNAKINSGLTNDELAAQAKVPLGTVNKILSGDTREPKLPAFTKIANALNVSVDFLLYGIEAEHKISNIIPIPEGKSVPLLGTIACGTPILAEENLDGQVIVPDFVHVDFALKCKGDSMIGARIMDGDIVCVRSQPDVDDGEIAAVLIGDEATLKRVYKIPGRLILRPENPAFQVMEYAGEELDQIKILGKAVYFISAVR